MGKMVQVVKFRDILFYGNKIIFRNKGHNFYDMTFPKFLVVTSSSLIQSKQKSSYFSFFLLSYPSRIPLSVP